MTSEWMDAFDKAPQAEEMEFEPVANGEYEAVITNASLKAPKEGKPAQVSFEHEITSGKFKGRKVFQNSQLTEKGAPYIKKDLATLGHHDVKGGDLPDTLQQCIGKEVVIYCKNKEYNGKTYTNVYLNEVLDPNRPKQMDMDEDLPF